MSVKKWLTTRRNTWVIEEKAFVWNSYSKYKTRNIALCKKKQQLLLCSDYTTCDYVISVLT